MDREDRIDAGCVASTMIGRKTAPTKWQVDETQNGDWKGAEGGAPERLSASQRR